MLTQVSVKVHYHDNVTEKLSICREKEQNCSPVVVFFFCSHGTAVLTLLVPQRVCVSTPVCTETSLVSFVSLFLSVLIQERRDNVCSQVRVGLLLDSHREHSASHSVRSSPHLCICCTLSAHPPTTVPPPPCHPHY